MRCRQATNQKGKQNNGDASFQRTTVTMCLDEGKTKISRTKLIVGECQITVSESKANCIIRFGCDQKAGTCDHLLGDVIETNSEKSRKIANQK